MRQPTPLRALAAIAVALTLIAAACGDDGDTTTGDGDTTTTGDGAAQGDRPTISIGAQDFGESAILGEIYAQALEAEGFDTRIQQVGGFRDLLFGAFESGDVNLAPDYVASELEFLNDNAGEATSDVDETFDLLQPYLEERGLVGLTPSDAVDTNSFVVTEQTADELDLRTLSDLADHQDLTLGAPQDCETNPFCIPGLQDVYGVDLSANFVPLDPGVVPTSLEEGAIDVGVIFSTDGRIADEGWVLLEDDQQMLAADNIFPVLTQDLADAYGDDLTDVLDGISADLTTEGVTDLNRRYDVEKEDAEDIAADWLADRG